MKRRPSRPRPLLPFALALLSTAAVAEEAERGFRPLLDGDDLDGWVAVNTAPSTWKVKDGMLICSGKPIGELRTEKMYQNFVLELEWRHMVPRGNAGVFVWADDITARGVPFHRGIEVQVLENAYGNTRGHTTHGDIFPIHGATMTPINGRGGSRAFPTEERSRPSPEWNHYRITCVDGDISLAVNGKIVTRGKDCSPRKGYICLESEGGVVHYRKLKIKELPGGETPPQHVAIADRGYQSLYTGVDLSGWKAGAGWEVRDWMLAHRRPDPRQPSPLVHEQSRGDFGFVVDVRLSEGAGAEVRPRGGGGIDVSPDSDLVGAALDPRRWNRLEGTVRGDKLSLEVNGKPALQGHPLDGPARGPLTLAAEGDVDFANIFVRELR